MFLAVFRNLKFINAIKISSGIPSLKKHHSKHRNALLIIVCHLAVIYNVNIWISFHCFSNIELRKVFLWSPHYEIFWNGFKVNWMDWKFSYSLHTHSRGVQLFNRLPKKRKDLIKMYDLHGNWKRHCIINKVQKSPLRLEIFTLST
jgi:hypothetical protein